MAMYDALHLYPAPVTIVNYTHARSMSSLIYCAARRDGDLRVMMPHSTFMFHLGTMSGEWTGKQFKTEFTQWEKWTARMIDIYVEAMKSGVMGKYSPARRRKWVERQMEQHEDVFLDAEQAVELGFATEVFGDDNGYDWKHMRESIPDAPEE